MPYKDLEKRKIHNRLASRQRRILHREEKMLGGARWRASRKSSAFDISVSDIVIPLDCPVCMRELNLVPGENRSTAPSLDAYNPSLGYVKGNIWVICAKCNLRKQDSTGEQLISFGNAVVSAWGKNGNKD